MISKAAATDGGSIGKLSEHLKNEKGLKMHDKYERKMKMLPLSFDCNQLVCPVAWPEAYSRPSHATLSGKTEPLTENENVTSQHFHFLRVVSPSKLSSTHLSMRRTWTIANDIHDKLTTAIGSPPNYKNTK